MATTTTQPAPAKEMETQPEVVATPGMLANFRHDMEELWARPFQMLFEPFSRTFNHRFGTPLSAWTPAIDAYEEEGELIVKADLPGLKKEDLKVTIEQGDLVLRGERKTDKEVKESDFYHAERNYGSFYRRMALPFEADPKLIAASFKNGVLEVKVPIPATSPMATHAIPIN